jgi:hypothetical protein
MSALQLLGQPPVMNGTGCGRPVVDLFRQVPGISLHPVMITGGATVSEDDDGYLHIPKRDLIGVVQALLQSERLKIADALPEARTLTAELLNFQEKITEAAHESFGAWRENQHDDVVLGLSLALWYADKGQREMRVRWL